MNDILNQTLFEFGGYRLTTVNVLSISLILIGVRILLFLLRRILFAYFKKKNVDQGRKDAIYLLINYFVWTIALVVCLETLGIHVTILIAGSAALLVGLGLGLQQIFQDLVSGIFILIEGTIKVNDVIELDGMVGKILSVNLRTSKVLTRDGIMIIVPNHKFIIEKITNWSHNSESTRFKVEVGVAYGSDVEKVREILLACAQGHEQIIGDQQQNGHAPFVRFTDFGDSALKFELYFWTTNIFHVEFIKSDLRFAIDKQFRQSAITIPFPQRDLHIKRS
ncbi:MAG: mechanosensitive ion channel [Nostocaceae cyanobacterium CSU_2_110]|nr:mechanosensitive ion channel [Nostocaceae cyanobacterium CSU_2_110]